MVIPHSQVVNMCRPRRCPSHTLSPPSPSREGEGPRLPPPRERRRESHPRPAHALLFTAAGERLAQPAAEGEARSQPADQWRLPCPNPGSPTTPAPAPLLQGSQLDRPILGDRRPGPPRPQRLVSSSPLVLPSIHFLLASSRQVTQLPR